MYDPSAGRFLPEDPVAGLASLPQTLNPYAYGRDNPFAYPDPSGRDTFGICKSASAGAGLGAFLQRCYVTDLTTVKQTTTVGGGAELVPGTFVGVGPQYSSAKCADSLQGVDGYGNISGTVPPPLGAGQGGQVGLFGGTDSVTGERYSGVDVQVGADPSDLYPIPVSSQAGASYTFVGDLPVLTWLSEQILPESVPVVERAAEKLDSGGCG
jgi:hypothetical protein